MARRGECTEQESKWAVFSYCRRAEICNCLHCPCLCRSYKPTRADTGVEVGKEMENAKTAREHARQWYMRGAHIEGWRGSPS